MIRRTPQADVIARPVFSRAAPSVKKTELPRFDIPADRKAMQRMEAFSWGMRGFINSKSWSAIGHYLRQWWITAFGVTPLPTGEVNANDVYQMIRYSLYAQDLAANGIKIPEQVRARYEACMLLLENREKAMQKMPRFTKSLFDYEQSTEFGQLFVTLTTPYTEEMDMIRKNETAKPATKPAKNPTSKNGSEKKTVHPAGKKSLEKKDGKPSPTRYTRSLLVQKKFTDEQLLSMVRKEYPECSEKQVKVYVSIQRSNLNRGEYPQEYDTKNGKIERIEAKAGK